MKELQNILKIFEQNKNYGQSIALATLVKAQGSTYRRPGARMLMTSQGQMVGSLSGGCLEGDVFEQAQVVMDSGKPIVVQYDTMSDDDIIWGLGLGCNGIVQILIERVEEESPLTPILHHPPNLLILTKAPAYQEGNSDSKLPSPLSKGGLRGVNHLAFLAECLHQRQAGILATVFHVEGQVKAEVATRLMVYPDGTLMSNIEDADLVAQIRDDAWKVLDESRSTVKSYPLPTGKAEVFIEVIQPPVPLMIFGAGHDAVPLVHLAQELGWYITLVDSRKVETTRERFSSADEVILSRPESIGNCIHINNRTMAVVMTHNYLHDLEILKILLPSPVRYLGILGPKSRTEKLLQDLQEQEIIPTENQLQRLYSPVGLNIGADTPEEIALSIVAEIKAVLTNHSGGSLKNKLGPIHD
ncbi:XdhC family protein [Allocoleopsis franciscana]|uniref:Xanthine and CO dehydrogenases maturation factor, XdhC/CoxF family n=1 Tax=Allocoleopsis franciscana PCC 7113 TaxID=1173027 RepID=K9W932_9CYAN|nr:XdhC/CoxI family protein [Allocoleopsis franciscana]AFZ16316.1 xanthine and CO dehydrogenases maturation factor, XdhC/CoxF family [Allocoleopsis franciscana PCC 7113]